jgi:hypothetical protein
MINFDGKLVNPFNITYVEKHSSVLSGGVFRVVITLADGTSLHEMMTVTELNEFEEMLTELIMGEEL